jgi:hypothetical protein
MSPKSRGETPATETHPDLAPLAFLIGSWRGVGVGGYPTIEDFRYSQEVTFAPLGPKPALAYNSRTWLLGEDGTQGRPLAAETGWWRPQPDGQVEVLLAHPTGITEVYVGTVAATRIDLATDVVARTASAKEVSAARRLYGLVDEELMYAMDMAAVGQPLTPHLSARLRRLPDDEPRAA